MSRVPEVVDCWVESGSMPFAELHAPFTHQEAILREKGLGGTTLYALYIEERTGLFVRSSPNNSSDAW